MFVWQPREGTRRYGATYTLFYLFKEEEKRGARQNIYGVRVKFWLISGGAR